MEHVFFIHPYTTTDSRNSHVQEANVYAEVINVSCSETLFADDKNMIPYLEFLMASNISHLSKCNELSIEPYRAGMTSIQYKLFTVSDIS